MEINIIILLMLVAIIGIIHNLWRISMLLSTLEDRINILHYKLIDSMKSPEQKKVEQKMIDMFIQELNKKGNENNESWS